MNFNIKQAMSAIVALICAVSVVGGTTKISYRNNKELHNKTENLMNLMTNYPQKESSLLPGSTFNSLIPDYTTNIEFRNTATLLQMI